MLDACKNCHWAPLSREKHFLITAKLDGWRAFCYCEGQSWASINRKLVLQRELSVHNSSIRFANHSNTWLNLISDTISNANTLNWCTEEGQISPRVNEEIRISRGHVQWPTIPKWSYPFPVHSWVHLSLLPTLNGISSFKKKGWNKLLVSLTGYISVLGGLDHHD